MVLYRVCIRKSVSVHASYTKRWRKLSTLQGYDSYKLTEWISQLVTFRSFEFCLAFLFFSFSFFYFFYYQRRSKWLLMESLWATLAFKGTCFLRSLGLFCEKVSPKFWSFLFFIFIYNIDITVNCYKSLFIFFNFSSLSNKGKINQFSNFLLFLSFLPNTRMEN